ncbi:hypothetical protein KCU59_g111, partial [Aureobasidium melanogenum]
MVGQYESLRQFQQTIRDHLVIGGLGFVGSILVAPNIRRPRYDKVAVDVFLCDDILDGCNMGGFELGDLSASLQSVTVDICWNVTVEIGTECNRRFAACLEKMIRCRDACVSSSNDDNVRLFRQLFS